MGRMRRRYTAARLLEQDAPPDPFTQFRNWLHDALTAGLAEPNAMVLSTATSSGIPSSRHVLLKELDAEGFVFFTNHGSRKAVEIAQNPHVALCFPWFPMERQVSVCGVAEAISREESQAYWLTRPRESQLGAWASAQSSPLTSRHELEAQAAQVAERFPDTIPLPEFWGGYRVLPETVEFWQGGPGRLHDRLVYRRDGDDGWAIQRLAP
nr:pyridoxamine 5'-phosphate oxidase [Phytoactinopolyspora alkaliphila]